MDTAEEFSTSAGEDSRNRRYLGAGSDTVNPSSIGGAFWSRKDMRDGSAMTKSGSFPSEAVTCGGVDDLLRPTLSQQENISRWRDPFIQLIRHYFIADRPYQELLTFLLTLFKEARFKICAQGRREVEIPLHLMPQLFPTSYCLQFLTGVGLEYEGVDSVRNLGQIILYVPPILPLTRLDAFLMVLRSLQSLTSQEAHRLTIMEPEEANVFIQTIRSLEHEEILQQNVPIIWDKWEDFLQKIGVTKQKHSRNHSALYQYRKCSQSVTFLYHLYSVIKTLHEVPFSLPMETFI